jgi:hypothetical protein
MKAWRKLFFMLVMLLLLLPSELVMASAQKRSSAVTPTAKVKLVSPLNNRLTKELKPALRWKLLKDATHYQLQLSPNKDFSGDKLDKMFSPLVDPAHPTIVVFTADNYGDLPWLTPNRRYYWHVRGCGSDQETDCGPWSASRFFIPKYGAADKVLLTLPLDGAEGVVLQPTFKWSRLANDELYEIMIVSSYNIRRQFAKVDSGDPGFVSFVPAAPLAGNTNFTWKVRAVGKSRWYYGPWSETFHFKTMKNPNPPAPTDKVKLIAPLNNALTNTLTPQLSWKAKADMVRYEVQISWDATFVTTETIKASIPANDNTLVYAFPPADYGNPLPYWLTENRPYYWEVRGCMDDTETMCTTWAVRRYVPRYRADQLPLLISPVGGVTVGGLQPELKWQRLPNDWKYEIWLINGTNVRRLFYVVPQNGSSEATYVPPPLAAGKTYRWKVRAVGFNNWYAGRISTTETFLTP